MIGVHHTASVTADVERSMRFWRDGLGFTELFDLTFTGDWPPLFDAKTDSLRSVFLGDPATPDKPCSPTAAWRYTARSMPTDKRNA